MFRSLLTNLGRTLYMFHISRINVVLNKPHRDFHVSRINAIKPHGRILYSDDDEEFIRLYENYFNRPEIDNWEIRKGMSDLHHFDNVPDPRIIIAGLNAARRLNDYALAVRFLEAVRFKCGPHLKEIWPYIIQEITPTLTELGVDTPECLGYDKPELAFIDYYY